MISTLPIHVGHTQTYLSCSWRSIGTSTGRYLDQSKSGLYVDKSAPSTSRMYVSLVISAMSGKRETGGLGANLKIEVGP
jgi:hypothetical protein